MKITESGIRIRTMQDAKSPVQTAPKIPINLDVYGNERLNSNYPGQDIYANHGFDSKMATQRIRQVSEERIEKAPHI